MDTDEAFARGIAVITAMLDSEGRPGDLALDVMKSQLQDDGTTLTTMLGLASVALALVHWREGEMGVPGHETMQALASGFRQT